MAKANKNNFDPNPKACPHCGVKTVIDQATWMTTQLRVHTDTNLMLCANGLTTPHMKPDIAKKRLKSLDAKAAKKGA